MEDSRESNLKKSDVIDSASSSSYLEDCKDLSAYSLENNQVSKRSRYLCPDTKTWSTSPLNWENKSHVYKRKQKNDLMNANFVILPEEIVLKIFKMMDRRTLITCTLVCHQWRQIAYDNSLWQQFNINRGSMSVLTLDHLLARNIKYFSAPYSNFYIIEGQYYCKTPFPKLQYLDLSSVNIHYKTLQSLLRQCCNLIELSLENCTVDSLCCQYIGRNTNLKVLNLASTLGLDRGGVKHIVSLQNLEELNVSRAKLKENHFKYLIANMIPNIKRLNISGFIYKLGDYDLSVMSNRCTKLIELDVSDNHLISPNSLEKIKEKNHELEVLTTNNCTVLTLYLLYSYLALIRNIGEATGRAGYAAARPNRPEGCFNLINKSQIYELTTVNLAEI